MIAESSLNRCANHHDDLGLADQSSELSQKLKEADRLLLRSLFPSHFLRRSWCFFLQRYVIGSYTHFNSHFVRDIYNVKLATIGCSICDVL